MIIKTSVFYSFYNFIIFYIKDYFSTHINIEKGGIMEAKLFILGLCAGMIGGALLVVNSQKARKFVKDSQDMIQKKAEEISENAKKAKQSEEK